MPELEAFYNGDNTTRWRKALPNKLVYLVNAVAPSPGPNEEPGERWNVDWDQFLSVGGWHAKIKWEGNRLRVQIRTKPKKPNNAIYYRGRPIDDFTIEPNEHFVIGQTVFNLLPDLDNGPGDQPGIGVSISAEGMKSIPILDANRLTALIELSDALRDPPLDDLLLPMVLSGIMRAISNASVAGIVRVKDAVNNDNAEVEVLQARDKNGPAKVFRPSRTLARNAIRYRQTHNHVWLPNADKSKSITDAGASLSLYDNSTDWAVCAPVRVEPSHDWAIYVCGQTQRLLGTRDAVAKDRDINEIARFVSLAADMLGSVRELRYLRKKETILLPFQSPAVRAVLTPEKIEQADKSLEAKQQQVSVLLCDVRGSCKIIDEGAGDLMGLWNNVVSEALAIMTRAICADSGIIGDFQGDSVLGFWNWPVEYSNPVERAAKAALTIRDYLADYANRPGHPLSKFACGIGIAHGPAMAGRIGTRQQSKIGVFGPVVNRAARLEGLTKGVGAQILLDETCAELLRGFCASGQGRLRRIARVLLHNMKDVTTIYQLLPPDGQESTLPGRAILDYEAGLNAFLKKQWSQARMTLEKMRFDGPTNLLLKFMDAFPQGPPDEWTGVIALDKGGNLDLSRKLFGD